MEYIVIGHGELHIFERAVNEAIEAGWEPLGGVAVTHYDGDSRYFYQAMTRRPQPGPPTIPFPHPVRPPSPTVRSSR